MMATCKPILKPTQHPTAEHHRALMEALSSPCCPLLALSSCIPKHFFSMSLLICCSFVHLLNFAVSQCSAFSSVLVLFCFLSLWKIPNFHLYNAETHIFIFKQMSIPSSDSFLDNSSQTSHSSTSLLSRVLPRHHRAGLSGLLQTQLSSFPPFTSSLMALFSAPPMPCVSPFLKTLCFFMSPRLSTCFSSLCLGFFFSALSPAQMLSLPGKTGSPTFILPWHMARLLWWLQHTVRNVICLNTHNPTLLFSRSAQGAGLGAETGFEI